MSKATIQAQQQQLQQKHFQKTSPNISEGKLELRQFSREPTVINFQTKNYNANSDNENNDNNTLESSLVIDAAKQLSTPAYRLSKSFSRLTSSEEEEDDEEDEDDGGGIIKNNYLFNSKIDEYKKVSLNNSRETRNNHINEENNTSKKKGREMLKDGFCNIGFDSNTLKRMLQVLPEASSIDKLAIRSKYTLNQLADVSSCPYNITTTTILSCNINNNNNNCDYTNNNDTIIGNNINNNVNINSKVSSCDGNTYQSSIHQNNTHKNTNTTISTTATLETPTNKNPSTLISQHNVNQLRLKFDLNDPPPSPSICPPLQDPTSDSVEKDEMSNEYLKHNTDYVNNNNDNINNTNNKNNSNTNNNKIYDVTSSSSSLTSSCEYVLDLKQNASTNSYYNVANVNDMNNKNNNKDNILISDGNDNVIDNSNTFVADGGNNEVNGDFANGTIVDGGEGKDRNEGGYVGGKENVDGNDGGGENNDGGGDDNEVGGENNDGGEDDNDGGDKDTISANNIIDRTFDSNNKKIKKSAKIHEDIKNDLIIDNKLETGDVVDYINTNELSKTFENNNDGNDYLQRPIDMKIENQPVDSKPSEYINQPFQQNGFVVATNTTITNTINTTTTTTTNNIEENVGKSEKTKKVSELLILPFETQASFASKSGSIRKTGKLLVQNLLTHKMASVVMATVRNWEEYFVCLRGTLLLFFSSEYGNDDDPVHTLVVTGCLAYPEDGNATDGLFSVSTIFGLAFLFKASNDDEMIGWIMALHAACASCMARTVNKSGVSKMLKSEIHRLENSIDLDLKMKKMGNTQANLVNDAPMKQALDRQLAEWDENLEKLYIEQFLFRCYLSALQDAELPPPRPLINSMSKALKASLALVGVVTPTSFHTAVCARVPLTLTANLFLSRKTQQRANTAGVSTFKADFSTNSTFAPSKNKAHNKTTRPLSYHNGSGSDCIKVEDSAKKNEGFQGERTLRVNVPDGVVLSISLNDKTTFQDLFDCVGKHLSVQQDAYFLRVKNNADDYKFPCKSDTVLNEEYTVIEVCAKLLFQTEIVRNWKERNLGFSVECSVDASNESRMKVVIVDLAKGTSSRKGLQVGDELLMLNGMVVADLDMAFMETILEDSEVVSLTLRSCRCIERSCQGVMNSSEVSEDLTHEQNTPTTTPIDPLASSNLLATPIDPSTPFAESSFNNNYSEFGNNQLQELQKEHQKQQGNQEEEQQNLLQNNETLGFFENKSCNDNFQQQQVQQQQLQEEQLQQHFKQQQLHQHQLQEDQLQQQQLQQQHLQQPQLQQHQLQQQIQQQNVPTQHSQQQQTPHEILQFQNIQDPAQQSLIYQQQLQQQQQQQFQQQQHEEEKTFLLQQEQFLQQQEYLQQQAYYQQQLQQQQQFFILQQQQNQQQQPKYFETEIESWNVDQTQQVLDHCGEYMDNNHKYFESESILQQQKQEKLYHHQQLFQQTQEKQQQQQPPATVVKSMTDSERICKVVLELLETERQYVQDLNCLIDWYLEPLKDAQITGSDEIEQLFGNIQEIVHFQKMFLQSLEAAVDKEVGPKTDPSKEIINFKKILLALGSAFLCYAHHFKLYSSFCASHSKAQKILLSDNNIPLQDFLKSHNPMQQHSVALESYLIKPIQRILKYPLLLKQLKELTTTNTEEHLHLKEALHGMEAVAEHINEMQKIYEEYGSVLDELSKGYKEAYPHARWLDLNVGELQMYGTVNWLNASSETVKLKKGMELLTLLFIFRSGVVLMAQEKMKGKRKIKSSHGRAAPSLSDGGIGGFGTTGTKYKTAIPVDQLQVRTMVGDAHECHGIWEMIHCASDLENRPEKIYQFASSQEARRDFIRTIHFSIRDSIQQPRPVDVTSTYAYVKSPSSSKPRPNDPHYSDHQHNDTRHVDLNNKTEVTKRSNNRTRSALKQSKFESIGGICVSTEAEVRQHRHSAIVEGRHAVVSTPTYNVDQRSTEYRGTEHRSQAANSSTLQHNAPHTNHAHKYASHTLQYHRELFSRPGSPVWKPRSVTSYSGGVVNEEDAEAPVTTAAPTATKQRVAFMIPDTKYNNDDNEG